MKIIGPFFVPVALALAVSSGIAAAPSAPAKVDLGWLAGHWLQAAGERRSEEIWLPPSDNLMLGVNQTIEGGETRSFEYLRIEIRGHVAVYWASPGGREATPFTLTESAAGSARFENPEHDFPQRITYRREGDRLDATIEGTVDGEVRTSSWSWQLVRP